MDLAQVAWRKAYRSPAQADSCVEVAAIPSAVAVRDSKDPDGPVVILRRQGFPTFRPCSEEHMSA
ncbi:DUF397 domain-containing protein [Actinomadura sp. SCN-SB]|uniref:DUF397 domain-containing protein n=1 Tax=Actinomadura sp. SCN-SB TaxID=3373092 RepID=UPI0037502F0A